MKNRAYLFTTDFPPNSGGIADYLSNICGLLADKVTVFTCKMANSSMFDTRNNYKIYRPLFEANTSISRTLFLLPYWIFAALCLAKIKPTIVLAGFISFQQMIAVYIAQILGIRTGVFTYGTDILKLHNKSISNRIKLFILKRADSIISISKYTTSLLVEIGIVKHKIWQIWPGVNIMKFALNESMSIPQWPKQRKIILSIGRLVEYKGFDTGISILPELLKAGIDVGYIIIGKGPDKDRLERLVKEKELNDRVFFAGFVSDADLSKYYYSCDVFSLLSRGAPGKAIEGFGIVYLEANACKKPVIGVNCGGIPDAVVHNETGLLVDVDNFEQTIQAFKLLLTDNKLRERLGENGYRRVLEKFAWEYRSDEVLKLFKVDG